MTGQSVRIIRMGAGGRHSYEIAISGISGLFYSREPQLTQVLELIGRIVALPATMLKK
jgi:hypothetical protein